MMRAFGFARRARRIACRACRSASAVTAQVLTTTASWRPAAAAAPRIPSLSKAFRRQPNVMTSRRDIAPQTELGGIEGTFEGQHCQPGHDDMPGLAIGIFAPSDIEFPAIQQNRRAPSGQAPAMRGDQGGAGTAAAGPRDASAALPDAQPDAFALGAGRYSGDAYIGALGKQRVVFEPRAERREIDGIGIGDKEGRVRVAHI